MKASWISSLLKEGKKRAVNKVILDASAFVAFLRKEKGGEEIDSLLGHIMMSSVNVSEAASILFENMSLKEVQECILPFLSSIIPFDEEQALKKRQNTKAYLWVIVLVLLWGSSSKLQSIRQIKYGDS